MFVADIERNHKNCDDDGTSTGGEEIKTINSTLNENDGTALPPPSVKVNEVESTIHIRNNIVPNGEKTLNGFSIVWCLLCQGTSCKSWT